MESILLSNHLSIKKLEPTNQKDRWLINELDKDELVSGPNGYLWPMKNVFRDIRYLLKEDIYGCPFGIYYDFHPVGYIELSDIIVECNKRFVDFCYAILEKERKKGYATKTLLEVSKMILLDKKNIEGVSLIIARDNIASQKVAIRSGFVKENLDDEEEWGSYQYKKTRNMIK